MLLMIPRKPDEEVLEILSTVVGVVEADSFAYQALWESESVEGRKIVGFRSDVRKGIEWNSRDQISSFVQVGELAGMPVTLCLRVALIEGMPVLFWESPSTVTDQRLVDSWLEEYVPSKAYRTNAMNFPNVVHHICRLKEQS